MIDFRKKGMQQERKLAKEISLWWCGDAKGLWRNTNSGARATVIGQVFGGDISPANASITDWPLCIEIKKAEKWSIENLIYGFQGEVLLQHMCQVLEASQLGCNKMAMLICTKNRKKPICFLHRHSFQHLPGTKYAVARVRLPDLQVDGGYGYSHPAIDFYCMTLQTFFQRFTREDFSHDRPT